jgi:hypothetical protein
MSNKRTFLDTLSLAAQVVTNLSIVFGIFVAGITLLSDRYDRRVTTTLNFYQTYNEKIRDSYLDLVDKWQNHVHGFSDFRHMNQTELQKVVLEFFANDVMRAKLENLLDFFDTLAICVNSRSCDTNTALDVLGKQVKNLYEISAYFTLEERNKDNDPTVGIGLEELYNTNRDSLFATVF